MDSPEATQLSARPSLRRPDLGSRSQRTAWILAATCGLSVLALLVFLPSILHGGFDDWGNVALYRFSSPPRFAHAVSIVHAYDPRPLLAYLKIGEAALFGSNGVPYRLTAVGLGVVVAVLVALVLLRLGLTRVMAGAAAILVFLFPWADSVHLWSVASLNQVSLIFYLAGLLAGLESLRHETRGAIAWHLAAWLLFAASMLTYEAAAALIPVSGLLYLSLSRSRTTRILAAADLVFGLVLVLLTYELHSHGRSRATIHAAYSDLGRIVHELASLVARALDPFTGHAGVAVAVAAALTVLRLGWLHRRGAAPGGLRRIGVTVAVSLIFALLAAGTLAGSGLHPLGEGLNNRGNLDVAVPLAVLVVVGAELVALTWLRSTKARGVCLGALLLAISVGYAIRTRDDVSKWDRAAAIQHKVLLEARDEWPPLTRRMAFLVFGYPAMTAPGVQTFAESWNLGPALSLEADRWVAGIPLFGPAHLTCSARGVYPISPPGPYDAVQGGEGRTPVGYGHAVLLNVADGTAQMITSRSRCERLAALVRPGPWLDP